MSDMLHSHQVRRLLGISRATFYRWLSDGKLAGKRAGRHWRFERAAVEALLDSGDSALGEDTRALHAARELLQPLVPPAEANVISQRFPEAAAACGELLIQAAFAQNARDLHLLPLSGSLQACVRQHDRLQPLSRGLPAAAAEKLLEALRQRCGLDGAEGLPQEGRCFSLVAGRRIEVHACLFPTVLGDALTLRLLDPGAAPRSLAALGFPTPMRETLNGLLARPAGLLLFNGPSGCGKSTTIYSLLAGLASGHRKLMSVEDPVERVLDGVLQCPLREGLDFPLAMHAMLRADVDVGYVAELRDAPSMQLLYQMARTGHLMLSSLHAPDALRALACVLQVGQVPPRLVADQTLAVVDQRLVGRSCPGCQQDCALPADLLAAFGDLVSSPDARVVSNSGCTACAGRGALGRLPIIDLLCPTPALRSAIAGGASAVEALAVAQPGDGLRAHLWQRVQASEVSVEQARRLLADQA